MAQSSHSSSNGYGQTQYNQTVQGYIHQLSRVKGSHNTKNKQPLSRFDCQLQTAKDQVIRLVCYSPKKRLSLQQAFESKTPVKIVDTKRNLLKRFSSSVEEHTGIMSKIMPTTEVNFPYNEEFDNNLYTVQEALMKNVYDTVDVKVKVMTKEEEKMAIVKNGVQKCMVNCMVADTSESLKITLWESLIDKVSAGKCYHFKNLTVRIFDDQKYLNTNEDTIIDQIDDDINVNMDAPQLKDNVVVGNCIGVDIKKSCSCVLCNRTVEIDNKEETVTCAGCGITTLTTMLKTKLVCHLVVKQKQGKIERYTSFNDGIQKFLTSQNDDKLAEEINIDDLKKKLLKAGEQKLVVDMASKIIEQFLK